MSSWLLAPEEPGGDIRAAVKQCVAVEYTPVSEWSQDSSLSVLIQHNDQFEWMDISHAIPATSEREYSPPDADKPKLTKLPTRA